MSLILGSLIFTACSSSDDEKEIEPEEPYEFYTSSSFLQYIKQQYSEEQTIMAAQCEEGDFSDAFKSVSFSGLALVKENGQYFLDGYEYHGSQKMEIGKIYKAHYKKVLSYAANSEWFQDEFVFGSMYCYYKTPLPFGYEPTGSMSFDWKENYTVKIRNHLYDSGNTESMQIDMKKFLTLLDEAHKAFINQNQQFIIGKWSRKLSNQYGKGYHNLTFNNDGTVIEEIKEPGYSLKTTTYIYEIDTKNKQLQFLSENGTVNKKNILFMITDNKLGLAEKWEFNERQIFYRSTE